MRVHVVAVMNKQARGGGRIGAVMGDTSNAERVSGPWMPLVRVPKILTKSFPEILTTLR
jgi:hypothetical protein